MYECEQQPSRAPLWSKTTVIVSALVDALGSPAVEPQACVSHWACPDWEHAHWDALRPSLNACIPTLCSAHCAASREVVMLLSPGEPLSTLACKVLQRASLHRQSLSRQPHGAAVAQQTSSAHVLFCGHIASWAGLMFSASVWPLPPVCSIQGALPLSQPAIRCRLCESPHTHRQPVWYPQSAAYADGCLVQASACLYAY